MTSSITLEQQISELNLLIPSLKKCKNLEEKIDVLNQSPIVKEFFEDSNPINNELSQYTGISEYVIKAIIAINQGPIVFNSMNQSLSTNNLEQLIDQLLETEKFYDCLGGIIGYHANALNLIYKQTNPQSISFNQQCYKCPEGLNLNQKDNAEIHQAVRCGIEYLNTIFEMYPIGGAGDRLNLKDPVTNAPLPVAVLPFAGRTLLEGLIRDVQGREYLYFKLMGKQIVIPIVLMTSCEKDNHSHIINIFIENHWFGRPKDLYFFIKQPLVPVITQEGNWSLKEPFKLSLKPSGHGVIWKLAEEQGVFKQLEHIGKHECLIRQINNPIAGTNNSLLALMGVGCHEQKSFGFLSCERLNNSSEGIDVIIEKNEENKFSYCLTNIEYTDFKLYGINNSNSENETDFSSFPTNTNILFAHIPSIRDALKKCPIPGQLINMKSKVSYIEPDGHQSWINGGRLESTMQNIADYIVDQFPQKLNKKQLKSKLKTFLIYNNRSHTISPTKKLFNHGESPDSTPEQSFHDLLHNNYLLLRECGYELPDWKEFENALMNGPACIFLFHPALGPLYSIIKQKIKKGHFHSGSELQLEIAEAYIENFKLRGSFLVNAKSPLGQFDAQQCLQLGFESRCFLQDVTVVNQGINYKLSQDYWKNSPSRLEKVEIILNEGSEFFAQGIIIEGDHQFEIPAYHKLVLQGKGKKWKEEYSPIQNPSWKWNHSFNDQNEVVLSYIKS
ncbi:MAG: UTP--glucose-1-phosphate uridylyltransferase [Parachlamydiaceae bacterium]|nr:UTP--glucose-1-phosphate uridylyltransferase [Parachlamydiaceae bacterium]